MEGLGILCLHFSKRPMATTVQGNYTLRKMRKGAASLVGLLHDGTAMPMAMVISLCGVLAVTVAVSTQRLQRARAAQAQV